MFQNNNQKAIEDRQHKAIAKIYLYITLLLFFIAVFF